MKPTKEEVARICDLRESGTQFVNIIKMFPKYKQEELLHIIEFSEILISQRKIFQNLNKLRQINKNEYNVELISELRCLLRKVFRAYKLSQRKISAAREILFEIDYQGIMENG